jgi:energy-coupling factor transport system permease protein
MSLRPADTRLKLVLLGCAGILAVLLERPASLGLLAACCALAALLAPVGARWRWRGTLLVLALVWSTVLSQGLFYAADPRVALVTLGPVTIYREGVMHGLVQSLRFVAVALAGVGLAASSSPDSLLDALLALRVPWGLAFLSATALRFLPVTGREIQAIRAARARRGRPVFARTPWAWLALEVAMVRPVLARSLRRAKTLAESLDARGFDASSARSGRLREPMPAFQKVVAGLATGLVALLVAGRVLFALYLAELVYVPALRPLYGIVRRWM